MIHNKSFLLFLLLEGFLLASPVDSATSIENISKQYLGNSYVWGGEDPSKGVDCSGYTKYVFNKVGIKIPRTALSQSKLGKTIDRNHLKKGDLLFFLTDKKRGIPITHVGIYLNNNKFIHAASSKKGIIISSLSGTYGKKLVVAKRILAPAVKINHISNLDSGFKNIPTQNISHYSSKMHNLFSFILDKEAAMATMDIKKTSFSNFQKL